MEEKFAGGNRVGKGIAPSRCATGTAPAPYFRLLINRMSGIDLRVGQHAGVGRHDGLAALEARHDLRSRLEERFAEVGFVGDHGTEAVAEGTLPAAQKKECPAAGEGTQGIRKGNGGL